MRPTINRNKTIVTKVSASGSAIELAQEHNVNWKNIKGSGKDGKVIITDVKKHLEAKKNKK